MGSCPYPHPRSRAPVTQNFHCSNWQPGEPNNADQGENCVMMLSSGKWNDAFCHNWLDAWVCEQLATCGSPATSDSLDDSLDTGST